MNSVGRQGEELAAKYLKNKRYHILAQNYRKRWGEIDIVAKIGTIIVFVEVKTTTGGPLLPEMHVNSFKKRRIIKTALSFLAENKYSYKTSWRIDVVAIEIYGKDSVVIRHVEGAITGDL